MSSETARGHVERDPRPTTDIGTNYALMHEGLFSRYALTEADVLEAAYAGYVQNAEGVFCLPEETPTSEVSHPVIFEAETHEFDNEMPPAETQIPLHLHADGRAKMMYEAESAAERRAIINNTDYETTEPTGGKKATRTLTTTLL